MPIVACPKCGAKNRVEERGGNVQPVCGKCGAALPAEASASHGGKPIKVTDANFVQTVVQADKPVLLDCWAPWCGPCRMIAPTIDQLAAESGGEYIVGKLNTDENPAVSRRFHIESIPTLLIFNGGEVVDQIVGLQEKQAIRKRLNRLTAVGRQ